MAMDSKDSEGVLGKRCYFLGLLLPWSSFPVFPFSFPTQSSVRPL